MWNYGFVFLYGLKNVKKIFYIIYLYRIKYKKIEYLILRILII